MNPGQKGNWICMFSSPLLMDALSHKRFREENENARDHGSTRECRQREKVRERKDKREGRTQIRRRNRVTIVDKNGSSSVEREGDGRRRREKGKRTLWTSQLSTNIYQIRAIAFGMAQQKKEQISQSRERLVRTGKGIGHKQPVNGTLSLFLPLVSFFFMNRKGYEHSHGVMGYLISLVKYHSKHDESVNSIIGIS